MDLDPTTTTSSITSTPKPKPTKKTLTLTTTTLSRPPIAYAHLSLFPPAPPSSNETQQDQNGPLDALQLRAYLTTALRQFLGDTGAAIPIDILLIRGGSAWVRVPRDDLPAFAGAVTAFAGVPSSSSGGGTMLLQLKGCGDWLGSLLGREEEAGLWVS